MKKINPVKAYCVVSEDGKLMPYTVDEDKDLIKCKYPCTINAYKGGIIPVLITPIKNRKKK